jgi:hypothetical protein
MYVLYIDLQLATAPDTGDMLAPVPSALRAALLPFQREGVQYGLARRGRVLIADEPGAGKTLQVSDHKGCAAAAATQHLASVHPVHSADCSIGPCTEA